MKSTLVTLVEDKPGVLNRVASLFRRRNFNIESLTVGHTDVPNVSRMTIVVDSGIRTGRHAALNLYKLVNVLSVDDVTDKPTVMRDLALIKVHATPETRNEVLQMAKVFRAEVVDAAPESIIIEMTGTEDRIDSLLELLRPYGILEMARTGRVAMVRGAKDNGRGPVDPT
jgi:acetolactate synthase-1/3 small subunit